MNSARRAVPLPVRSVMLGAEAQVRVQAITDPASVGDQPVIDVRIYRRSPEDISDIAFCPTSAGFRVPLHLSGLVADAMRHVGVRAAEHLAIAPPKAQG